eukprot:COSAG02_NODE_38650_length_426_cov_4.155963_1_plen_67_part_00
MGGVPNDIFKLFPDTMTAGKVVTEIRFKTLTPRELKVAAEPGHPVKAICDDNQFVNKIVARARKES